MGLKAELTTFVPYTQDKVELTKVTITNIADTTQNLPHLRHCQRRRPAAANGG